MGQGKFDGDAFARSDIMRRLADVERDLRALQTARRLEAAAIGAGGLRIQGGRLLAEDAQGERVFEVGTVPPGIFMRPELIETVSAEVFAARIHNDNITTGVPLEGTTSTTFTDLTTVGPTVPGVDISPAGKALVILSAALVPGVNDGAVMSFEVTGATSRPADDDRALILERGADFVGATVAAVLPITGLNAGVHQFRAKYRSEFGQLAEFDRRGLTVMAF